MWFRGRLGISWPRRARSVSEPQTRARARWPYRANNHHWLARPPFSAQLRREVASCLLPRCGAVLAGGSLLQRSNGQRQTGGAPTTVTVRRTTPSLFFFIPPQATAGHPPVRASGSPLPLILRCHAPGSHGTCSTTRPCPCHPSADRGRRHAARYHASGMPSAPAADTATRRGRLVSSAYRESAECASNRIRNIFFFNNKSANITLLTYFNESNQYGGRPRFWFRRGRRQQERGKRDVKEGPGAWP